MSLTESLSKARLFTGLSQKELDKIAALSQQRVFDTDDTILSEGETSRELFIIGHGMVEISLKTADTSTPIVNLGTGQIFGEMAMVDRGARSATAKAVNDNTQLLAIPHDDLLKLCEDDNHIGFTVMRNLATEMSLKLRFANIAGQMDASR